MEHTDSVCLWLTIKLMTTLDKDLSRETTVRVGEREIQITLTEGQGISMKLKGMKTGAVEISIEDLYKQLTGGEGTNDGAEEAEEDEDNQTTGKGLDLSSYKVESKFLVSLHDIRSYMMVKPIEMDVKVKLESILVELIRERMERKK